MKKYLRFLIAAFALFGIFSLTGCYPDDDDDDDDDVTGQIGIEFEHFADGSALLFDTLNYTNAAGNNYLVYEIQYFISRLTIYKGGQATVLNGWVNQHYVDTDIPSTQTWDVYDQILPGTYDSLAFTFGMTEDDNNSFMFVNPPESNMVWPEPLGGGYHYMKLNGKWLDSASYLRGFAFHIGPGQTYVGSSVDSIIDNSFRLSFNTPFTVKVGERQMMTLKMNIEEWFKNPHTYDHNVHGGDIMQNQAAMNLGCENGRTVFELSIQ